MTALPKFAQAAALDAFCEPSIITCDTCKGKGWLWSSSGPCAVREDCDDCGGHGQWEDEGLAAQLGKLSVNLLELCIVNEMADLPESWSLAERREYALKRMEQGI